MGDNNEKIVSVINILKLIKENLQSQETEILHSQFDSKQEIINELDTHVLKLKKKDFSGIKDLTILFAPTSDLQ